MHKGHGLRRYLYEYVVHQSIGQVREQTAQVVPISQAKAIRRRVDELLGLSQTTLADPQLGVPAFVRALNTALNESVPAAEAVFVEETIHDATFQAMQTRFMHEIGMGEGASKTPALPISPYDPRWSMRATIKNAGTALTLMPDYVVDRQMDGMTDRADSPEFGEVMLLARDADGNQVEAGSALTDEDAAGLTMLRDHMSVREYHQVRDWVIDGWRDPRTDLVDRSRFMSAAAVDRSVAMLGELQAQGLAYRVQRDQNPGQIKAVVEGTGMEIRLTESRAQEAFAGARVYDNGVVVRYSTNHRLAGNQTALHSPSPSEAVELLRFAQGRTVMRKDRPTLAVGQVATSRDRNGKVSQDSYHGGGKDSMFVVGDLSVNGRATSGGPKLMLRREAANRTLADFFVNEEAAMQYLSEAVTSARANLRAALDVDRLLEAFAEQRAEGLNLVEFEPPVLSSDPEIVAIQRTYWDVLTGRRDQLLRPGATEQMYNQRLGMIGELQADGDVVTDFGQLVLGGTDEAKIREHADEVIAELIGTVEPETLYVDGELVEKRFDPARVAKYMSSAKGQWSNMDDLAHALRRIEASPDQMRGSGFQADRFKDRLIRFDPMSAVPVAEVESDFLRSIGATVATTLEQNAATPTQLLIDDHGVISWTAEKMKRDGSTTTVTGQIGQVFDVGPHGELITQFASGENALVVPGYEARIAAQVPGETRTVEERTLLRGYQQLMTEQIRYQIANDLLSGRSEVGEGASVNRVYARLYGTRHPVDHLELSEVQGEQRLNSWTTAILATEARRIRYSNDIKAGSTVYAEYQADRVETDPADDNHFDAWKLTGGRNMAVLNGTDQSKQTAPGGYFDPVMTGGALNQGIVRYLTEDAVVNADGSITPGDPTTVTGSRTPLMSLPELDSMRYDSWDRQQMTASTLMQSAKITEPTGTAMMTFGGWTADDPIVVSREFARAHQIRGVSGQLRDLVVGDKLSDLHGNKGVVSLVIDRDMTSDEAATLGIADEVLWFKANPDMDVVMSPFSLISRRNAGSARELLSGQVRDLIEPHRLTGPALTDDRARVSGALGRMRFIVTHMAVDEKTKVYDDEQLLAGKGRKASSQLAWALQSQDCPAVMAEFYGHNASAEANLREYMRTAGLDMDPTGTMRLLDGAGTDGPQRHLFEMPELVRHRNTALNTRKLRSDFGAEISNRGGDLEMPFPLTFPTGHQTEQVGETSWAMPLMSSHLRSGQEFDDGTVVTHDWTNRYIDIFTAACQYRGFAEQLADPDVPQTNTAELNTKMAEARSRAQRSFEAITTDLQHRVFSGKHNLFKTGLMASRLPDSATAVWTSDPRLDIDQVAVSPVMADQLNLVEGDHALIWRDPVLRDAGVRYMRVTIDDRLTGVAINPVMDACFDGDFDGDSVAVVKLHSSAARAEAMAKLSVPANLLDTGVLGPDGLHPLAMQISLDTQVALHRQPELAEEMAELRTAANAVEQELAVTEPELVQASREDLTSQLSDLYRRAQSSEFGTALTFGDLQSHLNSVRDVCVTTGAKGNVAKLQDYARYLGGHSGRSGITEADQRASMFATAIKAHGTGLGGSYSQRAVRALRNVDLEAVLEVTYPVTQSILQAKHDAAEARHKYEALHGPGRDLWRGRQMVRSASGTWTTTREGGEPIQATKDEWVAQFIDFYSSKDGFNVSVNPAHVERVAAALADPETGMIRNLEEDPALQGTLMDRMAHGGEFRDLLAAAKRGENLFDGEKNEQFCSAPTRRARQAAATELDGPGTGEPVVELADEVLKRDVLRESHQAAQARGARRRSPMAVGVMTPTALRTTWNEFDSHQSQMNDDYEMGA